MLYNLQVFLFSSLPLLLALLILKLYFSSSSKSHKNLPPSPPKLPIIGNLHQLGSGTHRNLQSMAQTYGPLMLLHFGTRPVVVASSVDAAKEILKTHDLIFADRPSLSVANRVTHGAKDISFAPYGEYWRQLKSLSVLHLLSNKQVYSYKQVREDELVKMIEKIQGDMNVNLSHWFISLTLNVVCRVGFGQTYDEEKFKTLTVALTKVMKRFSFENFIPSLAWLDRYTGLHSEADIVGKQIDDFYGAIIDEHQNKKDVGGVKGQAFVDILLEIQKDNLTGFRLERYMMQGILQDVVTGATDTTSNVLVWAFSELLQHPHAMTELQKEARKIGRGRSIIPEEDLHEMPYLKAVIKEALRLHPPNPILVPHKSTKDAKVLGYDIPSGTQVIINAWAIARDPLIWDDQQEFKPERFLNSTIDYMGFDFELIPFGAGRRGCPGIRFATIIIELALANLAYKFDFAAEGRESLDMTEDSGIALQKKFPLIVKATPCE